jgi:hypothetical protein
MKMPDIALIEQTFYLRMDEPAGRPPSEDLMSSLCKLLDDHGRKCAAFATATLLALGMLSTSACSGDDASQGAPASGGSGGNGGTSVSAGASGSAETAGNTSGSGGAGGNAVVGSGGSGGSSMGGSSNGGSAGDGTGDASAGSSTDAAGNPNVPANFFMRYEAESPLNTLTYPVEGVTSEGAPCPADGVKEGANCSSGGKVVNQILGRSPCNPPTSTTSYNGCQNKGGGVQFNQVTVPADGSYDITWWYHCGQETPGHADVYGDTTCGGLDYKTGPGSGCRPHLIDVNGVPVTATVDGKMASYFQFPCYPVSWSILHGATTSLQLKAGANTIYIHAPGATTLDAADIDAIDVQPPGRGVAAAPLWPQLVTPVVKGN